LPIGLTKAVIRRATLLVSTDSGPRFFGVAFGVPTVTLFGPTSVAMTQTYGAHETSLSLELDCQPCMARTCPLSHHRCMRELSVERVMTAVDGALGAKSRAAVAA
jgi:heptosyltransferase-2